MEAFQGLARDPHKTKHQMQIDPQNSHRDTMDRRADYLRSTARRNAHVHERRTMVHSPRLILRTPEHSVTGFTGDTRCSPLVADVCSFPLFL